MGLSHGLLIFSPLLHGHNPPPVSPVATGVELFYVKFYVFNFLNKFYFFNKSQDFIFMIHPTRNQYVF